MKSKLLCSFIFCTSIAFGQNIYTMAGNGTSGFSGDGGQSTVAELNRPDGVAVDNSGNVYVADFSNYRIRKVNTGGIITTIAGNGTYGYSGNGGPATAANIGEPGGIIVDGSGNIYYSDQGLYDYRMISSGGIINAFVAIGNCNNICSSGDGAPATAANIWGVWGTAVDNAGNVYVTSADTYTIRYINSGIINNFAGSKGGLVSSCATCYPGIIGFSGDGGPATAAELNNPSSVAADAFGNVYIGDKNNNRIRKVNTNGIITTIAGNGTAGFSGDGGPATAAELNAPTAVAVDNAGNVYICDGSNNRVRMVNTSGIITTVAGNGTTGFSGDGGPATAAELNVPCGIAIDGCGQHLYIADENNNRIRLVITLNGLTSTATKTTPKCNGENTGSASVIPTNGIAPYTYSWNTGQTTSNITGLSAGTYICTATDSHGCITYDTVTITQPAALSAGTTSINATCSNSNGSAIITASGGTGTLTYSWAPTGGSSANATGLSAGTYTCTVTDTNGCSTAKTAIINNTGAVKVTIRPDTTITLGDSVMLFSSGGGTYLWNPSTGLSCTNCASPVAKPGNTTTYCVLVTDSAGCSDSACVTVKVNNELPCGLDTIPNIFTPNNDGINDDFVIKVKNLSSYSINIYDRWGKEVYESTDQNIYWNGLVRGTNYLVPDGVYYYIIKATCTDNPNIKTGFVNVIGGK